MGALQNLEKGDFYDALKDIENSLSNVFTSDLIPALKTFINQFASDFGAKVLSDAAVLAPEVVSGTVGIVAAGTQLLQQAASQAGSIATQDAVTVALNALRVQVTALTPPNSVSATPPGSV
jgi:hypothetical protein